jgi:hypothetical protein
MPAFLKRRLGGALIACAIASLALPAIAQSVPPNAQPDATLRSTPQTVVWGYISADLPPALTIKSGQTVKIDTVSHQGLLTKDPPVTFFGVGGIPPEQVLQDATDIYHMVSHVNGLGAHVLTKAQSCSMNLARRAAWFAPGGNASYLPALLFARVGAEDPRYPRPLRWLLPFGGPGVFFSVAATDLRRSPFR